MLINDGKRDVYVARMQHLPLATIIEGWYLAPAGQTVRIDSKTTVCPYWFAFAIVDDAGQFGVIKVTCQRRGDVLFAMDKLYNARIDAWREVGFGKRPASYGGDKPGFELVPYSLFAHPVVGRWNDFVLAINADEAAIHTPLGKPGDRPGIEGKTGIVEGRWGNGIRLEVMKSEPKREKESAQDAPKPDEAGTLTRVLLDGTKIVRWKDSERGGEWHDEQGKVLPGPRAFFEREGRSIFASDLKLPADDEVVSRTNASIAEVLRQHPRLVNHKLEQTPPYVPHQVFGPASIRINPNGLVTFSQRSITGPTGRNVAGAKTEEQRKALFMAPYVKVHVLQAMGRIDRIDFDASRAEVIDLKDASERMTRLSVAFRDDEVLRQWRYLPAYASAGKDGRRPPLDSHLNKLLNPAEETFGKAWGAFPDGRASVRVKDRETGQAILEALHEAAEHFKQRAAK